MSEVVVAPPVRPATRSRAATRQLWMDRLARFPASGLTVAQFCASEAVSQHSFYFWKRRLAAETQATTPQDPSRERGPRLLPVRLQPAAPAVELVLTTGTVLRLPPGCDLTWVRSLVTVLGEPSC
jgi:transposase